MLIRRFAPEAEVYSMRSRIDMIVQQMPALEAEKKLAVAARRGHPPPLRVEGGEGSSAFGPYVRDNVGFMHSCI